MNKLLEATNLTKSFEDGRLKTNVLHDVSFTLETNESVAIVGESGSGKSTLLHLLGTLDAPTSGEIFFDGQNVGQLHDHQRAVLRNQKLGFIYQFHHLLPEFDAQENVAMPALIAGEKKETAHKKAKSLLNKVGLSRRLNHLPSELSGGERQRVAIARALINKPQLVLADEPTGNLDAQSAQKVYQLMCDLTKAVGTSFLVVTHDPQLASKLDRTLYMSDGILKRR